MTNITTDPNRANRYLLKGFLAYLQELYSSGRISEEGYVVIAERAIALSLGAIATNTVHSHLHKYENYLAKLKIENK